MNDEDYIDDYIREDSIETEISFEDKYINKLKEIYENYKDDNEALHILSDDCLLDFLEESGHENIAKLYKRNKESFWFHRKENKMKEETADEMFEKLDYKK